MKDWPGHVEIKGRVGLNALEKFSQELLLSRTRAVMVYQVSFCCMELIFCLHRTPCLPKGKGKKQKLLLQLDINSLASCDMIYLPSFLNDIEEVKWSVVVYNNRQFFLRADFAIYFDTSCETK